MRSLSLKLILAFLAVSLTGTVLVAFLAILTTRTRFNQFVFNQNRDSVVSVLADYYRINGEWKSLPESLTFGYEGRGNYWGPRPGGPPGGGPQSGRADGSPLVLIDNQGNVLISGMNHKVGDRVSNEVFRRGAPIVVDGREVGRLLLAGNDVRRRLAGPEAIFLAGVNRALVLGTIGGTAVAVLLGIFLARTLTRPLKELTAATRAVAKAQSAGDLDLQVPVRSKDELGELAASFNQMISDLAHARDLRHQMTADIAHDLRTPLSVILGHSEALSEGVLPATPETFEIMHDEALRLNRLVDQLRTLSLAEAGELPLTRRMVAPGVLLKRAATAHLPMAKEQEIAIEVDIAGDVPEVNVDPDRLAQVLDNLLSNALRFTPAGGRVTLSALPGADTLRGASTERGEHTVRFIVKDSGPGIPVEELPNVFERFYRGDKARQRLHQRLDDGGSGLGLAIAKSIVEAHGGRIWAECKPGQGVAFIMEFPIQ